MTKPEVREKPMAGPKPVKFAVRFVAGIALCAALAPAVALAAGTGSSTWDDATDCSACHQKEAASFEVSAADSATSADAVQEPAEAAGQIAAVAADDGDAKAAVAAEASTGDAAEGEETASSDAGQTLAQAHAALDCLVCHSDTDVLAKVHEGATAESTLPKRLKKAKIDEELCLSCHDSYETLAQATADSTALTDTEGTVVNPHDLPDVADHAKITCLSCHKVHSDATAQKTATATCVACHHEGVYACGTCHSHE